LPAFFSDPVNVSEDSITLVAPENAHGRVPNGVEYDKKEGKSPRRFPSTIYDA